MDAVVFHQGKRDVSIRRFLPCLKWYPSHENENGWLFVLLVITRMSSQYLIFLFEEFYQKLLCLYNRHQKSFHLRILGLNSKHSKKKSCIFCWTTSETSTAENGRYIVPPLEISELISPQDLKFGDVTNDPQIEYRQCEKAISWKMDDSIVLCV